MNMLHTIDAHKRKDCIQESDFLFSICFLFQELERNSIIGDQYRWPHTIPYVLDDSLGMIWLKAFSVDTTFVRAKLHIMWPFSFQNIAQ